MSYNPFESEVAGLRYACKKEDHYLRFFPEIRVFTDAKELISTWAKPLEKINNQACTACKTNSKSKPNVNGKRVEVRPSTMEIAAPGEMICTDFADFGRISLFIIKDRLSGLLAVYVTKDKTSELAIRCICK